MLALQRRRPWVATLLAVTTALASPVAALFSALGGIAYAIGAYVDDRRASSLWPGVGVVAGSLVPVLLLAYAFPEGGSEPFTLATLWPIPLVAAGLLAALPRRELALRVGVLLYTLGCIVAYEVSTPIGSNAARLGALVAGPLAALALWPRHRRWLLLAAFPLVYLQWQAPVRDVNRSANDPSVSAAFYKPLLAFLDRQDGPPFRVEIPFTKFHWETYDVAPYFPLARGWERQLDIKYNHLFYDGSLTPATYESWLEEQPVRFVAVSDARLDFSADKETALIDRGLPYCIWCCAPDTRACTRSATQAGSPRARRSCSRSDQLADPRRTAGRHGAAAGAVYALLGDRSGVRMRRAGRGFHQADASSTRRGAACDRFSFGRVRTLTPVHLKAARHY